MNVGVGNGIRMLLKIEEKRQRNEKGRKERKGGGGKRNRKKDTKITNGKNVKVHYTCNCFIILEIVSDAA